MKGLLAWLVLYLQILLIRSKGICPGDLVPCSGSCTERLSSNAAHSAGERSCSQRGMRLFQGLREGGDVEPSCKDALPSDRSVWTRYKISSGRTVDETGTHVQNLDWDLEYCVTMRNTQQFAPRSCSWASFRAVCVTPDAPISQSDASRCEREWYHVSAQNYNFRDAYNYCRRNDMNLAVPATASRINCLKSVIKTKNDDAWIDYKIREATFPIDPWDESYCVKIDVANRYTIDRCNMQLPIVCGSFGELEVRGSVVMKGNEGVLTCKCTDCQPSQVEWTDGLSTWHSNTNYHDKEVVTLCQGDACTSTLTIKEAPADQAYSCVQRIMGGSIVYGAAKLDVYDLTPSEHYITAGTMITMTCSFFNEEHNGVQRVDWIDQRDRNNITRMKKEEWQGQMVTSYVEILREEYTHNVSCNFVTDLGNFAGMVQIVIYEIRASDVEVPADTVATLLCELEIGQGSVKTGVSPTSTYWEQGKRTYTSESTLPYMALLNKEMRLGKDLWACHFRFKNGDLISRNIWVNAFELSGLSGDVARNETGYMTCTYSRGALASLFWEREGVRVLNNNYFEGETFKITGNSRNDSFYQAFTSIEIHNARRSANYSCCVKVIDGVIFRRLMHLNVYPGNFLANNITITELVHPESGEIVVTCTVSAFPPPFITIVVSGTENKLLEGTTSILPTNVSTHTTTYPRTCEKVSFTCAATNKVVTRTMIAESDLGRACGIFAKVSLKIWGIIAGVIFVLIILIILLCCCFCRRNRKLKEEVVSQREILSNVGGSVHYGQNIANSRMMLPSHDIPYSDYYESGKDYDDVYRKGIIEDDDLIMAKDFPKNQPLLSPRSQSRSELQQMFSPQLEKKMKAPTLSYQNLRNAQHTPSYRSEASFVKPGKRSNSTHSLTKDDFQMNPYGKFQRLKNEEADFDMDEEMSLFSKAPSSASRHPPSSLGMSSSPPHEPYYEEPMRMPGLLSPRDWDKKSVASSAAPSAGAPLFSPLIRRSPSLNDLKEDHDPFNYNSWKGEKDPIREFQPIDTDEELSPNMQRAHRKNTLPRKSMDVDMELQELSEANINRMFSPLDNRVNDGLISSASSAFKKPTPLRNMNSSPLSSSQSDRTPNSINNLGLRNVSRTENNTPITERESHPSTDATLEISASPYHSQSFPRNDLNNGPHTSCTISCSANCPKSPSFKRPIIDSNYHSEVSIDPQSGDYDTLPSDYAPPPGGDWMGSKSTFASEMGSDPLDWKGSALTELTLDDLSQVDDEFSKRNSFLDGPRPKKSGSIPSMATSSRAGTPKNRLPSIQDDSSSVASSKIGNTKSDLGGVKVLPTMPLGRAMLKKTGSKFLT